MVTASEFWDRVAERYARRTIKNQGAYEQTLAATAALLSREDRVLELGCGTGSTALRLADRVAHITATDGAPKMVRIAEEKRLAAGMETVEMQVATPATAPAGAFDAVLAFNFLHLLDDLEDSLAQIHARTRPGGVFISKTVCLGEMTVLLRPVIWGLQRIGWAPYVQYVTTAQLEAAIAAAGFEIEQSCTFDDAPRSRFIAARRPAAP